MYMKCIYIYGVYMREYEYYYDREIQLKTMLWRTARVPNIWNDTYKSYEPFKNNGVYKRSLNIHFQLNAYTRACAQACDQYSWAL